MAEQDNKPKVTRTLFRKIVNASIGIFLGLIVLLIILLGFTQTYSFREWLREKVITSVNEEINGKLNIENIDGTILTSLFLRNTSLTIDGDTLFYAKNIEIKTSPLQLLIKKIYFRKILFQHVKVKMLQDQNGEWNFAHLSKKKEEDTTKSSFPFTVQVNDLKLKDIQFTKQSYEHLYSEAVYKNINFDDLRISDLYLAAQAYIDIDNSDYLLNLKEFSFKPNLTRFTLRNISGDLALTKEFVNIKNFAFITDSSDIRISARLDSLNVFGNIELDDFKNYPMTIDLDAASFNFDDLSSFIDNTEILKGNPSLRLKAHGKFGRFSVDQAILDYRNTHFEFNGEVLNLNNPGRLYIKTHVKDTDLNYRDVNALLPTLQLPEFAKLTATSVNIDYEGEPADFKTKFSGLVENGQINFDCAMNLNNSPATYDIKFDTDNLNLMPVFGIPTNLNTVGTLIGKGFSPTVMSSDFNLDIRGSTINHILVDQVSIKSKAQNKKFSIALEGYANRSEAIINTDLDFKNDTIPAYSIYGTIKNLNVASFTKNPENESNLNFYFGGDGESFDIDKINGSFSFGVDSSSYRDTDIPTSSIDLILKNSAEGRAINLKSDFVDFNIDGTFSLKSALQLMAYESGTISNVISNKLAELNPANIVNRKEITDTVAVEMPAVLNEDIKFNYDFTFKNFDLISALIGNNKLDIVGSGKGSVSNKAPNFSINTELNLDYAVYMQDDLTVYLSDTDFDLNFTRDNRDQSFEDLFGTVSLTGKRFYSGGNITNIMADITFNQSKLFYNFSADIGDNLSTYAEGTFLMTPVKQQILVDKLEMLYNGLTWDNDGPVKILYDPEQFTIDHLVIKNDTSYVSASGSINHNGNQNIKVEATNISGEILSQYLTGFGQSDFIADGDAKAVIAGTLNNPTIDADLKLGNLSYNNFNLGSFIGKLNYSDKNIHTEFNFLDSTSNKSQPLLSFKGNIPIDLSFTSVENRIPEGKSIDLYLKSGDFKLNSLGNLLPGIKNQQGSLDSDIKIGGTFDSPQFNGYMVLRSASFRSTYNNLDYSFGSKIELENNVIKIDSLIVANSGGTNYPGIFQGVGSIILDGYKIKDMNIRLFGDLAVLSPQSRSVSPLFYGDLQIGSTSDWLFTKRNDKYNFQGDILLKQTNITYTTTQEQSEKSNNFNIIYVVDSSKIDKEQERFQKILLAEKQKSKDLQSQNEKPLNFDYNIGVSVDNTARMVFILSQAASQKLSVEMTGDLRYESYGGETRAQGGFDLIQGSKLEFLKTFSATGIIRFESDITNPYLDIVATYLGEYNDPRSTTGGPEQVAVKIKIKGPLSELGKNLTSDSQSIGVYTGSRDIASDTRNPQYSNADALSFILFGKFFNDLTAKDKTQLAGETKSSNALGNAANSFLGSILTNYLNSAVGDLINNVEINNTNDGTKISLSGRIQNLRYSFGGTTEVFQNIGKANFKLEYGTNFLIRLEGRDPIGQNYSVDQKVYEIALKYKFEF